MTSDADRIRIAIAVCALKFKPPDQSFASYVLDLRSKFSPSQSSREPEHAWRTHALRVERDFSELQVKYEAEHIKLLALTSAADAAASASIPTANTAQPSSSTATKKKTKKRTSGSEKRPEPPRPPTRVDLETVFQGVHDHIPAIPGPNSLFSTYTAFHQLTSLPFPPPHSPESLTRTALLLSTTTRAIEAIASVLLPVLTPTSPDSKSHDEILQTLSTLLQHLLCTALPLLTPPRCKRTTVTATSDPVNALLNTLMTKILHPLIHSFAPLSLAHLSALFPSPSPLPTSSSKNPPIPPCADPRPSALSLFRHVFCLLAQSIPNGYGLSESLALETTRELKYLYASPEIENENEVRTARDDRVKTLGRKDTLWYLCSILHLVFTPSTKTANANLNPNQALAHNTTHDEFDQKERRLLQEDIMHALSGLLRRCAGQPAGTGQVEGLGDGTSRGTGWGKGLGLGVGKNPQGQGSPCSGLHECGSLNGIAAGGINAGDVSRQEDWRRQVKEAVDIDDVGHEMVLAVVERYWIWSCESR